MTSRGGVGAACLWVALIGGCVFDDPVPKATDPPKTVVRGVVRERATLLPIPGVRVCVEPAEPVWTGEDGSYSLTLGWMRTGTATYEKGGYTTAARRLPEDMLRDGVRDTWWWCDVVLAKAGDN